MNEVNTLGNKYEDWEEWADANQEMETMVNIFRTGIELIWATAMLREPVWITPKE